MNKPKGLTDYLAVFARRRWWVIVPFLALSSLTVLVARIIPRMYLSETMILIQPRDVPTDFVKDLLSGSTEERLNAIEEMILSRSNLLSVLRVFEDRLTGYRGLNDERKYLKLKKRVTIEIAQERSRGKYLPVTNFRISYRDQDPELAQKITAELAKLFMKQDSKVREDQVFGTTEFLEEELNNVSKLMNKSSNELKSLKERYRYELPTELETNLRTLDRLQIQKNANVEALDRHLTMQMTLERQLSETPPTLVREVGKIDTAGTPANNPLVEELHKKELQYAELRLKATDDHPDVVRARAEVERLRKEIPPADLVPQQQTLTPLTAPTTITSPNPVYQSLTAQLQQIRTEIGIREREKKQIEAEMARYSERVQNTPKVEQDMAKELRANEDLTRQYDELKSKLAQAELAKNLERKRPGSQFMVIDPANYPLEPVSPGLPRLIGGGLAFSLLIGIALAVVVDLLGRVIWTERDLARLLDARILVEIPSIVTQRDISRAWRAKLRTAALAVVAAGFYGAGLYFLYLKQSYLLRLIDPLLERITG
jgi:polysaccharide chain length determinant protein (PEP-CTERM system associated)